MTVREGPLEKLRGAGGGGIFEQHDSVFSFVFPLNEYFFVKMLCSNIFFPQSNTKLKKH